MLIILLIETIFFAIVVLITLYAFHTTTGRSYFIDILCIVFNIGMYTSPLTVMIPNSLGALSGLIQLSLYATYYKTTNWDSDDMSNSKRPIEVQMSDV
ncbi:unnamed protein product [Citrullus colocynthis]|uniref:Uncharacterized protein n=1 Tax=Citrullus colocynthis TaxID=252529 RepID=A0ABP0XZ05_9ROSI